MSARRSHLHTAAPLSEGHYGGGSMFDTGQSSGNASTHFDKPSFMYTPPQNTGPVAMSSNNNGMFDEGSKDLWGCSGLCTGNAKSGFNLRRRRRRAMPNAHLLVRTSVESTDEAEFVGNIAINFVVLSLRGGQLKVLCHQRAEAGGLTLPSGYLHLGSRISHSARKHLNAFIPTEQVYHEPLQVFDDRELETGLGVLRVACCALLKPEQYELALESSHCEPQWHSIDSAMSLVGDQRDILRSSLQSLRDKAKEEPIVFRLLPDKFTLSNLQEAYEALLGVQFRKSNFRRKIAKMTFLVRCQERQKDVAHRAAELYSFDETLYQDACSSGFAFPV